MALIARRSSLVLPLVYEVLKGLLERVGEGLIPLKCLLQNGVQTALEFQQQLHHVLVLQPAARILTNRPQAPV